MLEHPPQTLVKSQITDIHGLYERHAGMLLGYIFDVTKNQQIAEEYLEKIFSAVSLQFDNFNWQETNTWCQLQRFAKQQMSILNAEKNNNKTTTLSSVNQYSNQYLDQLSELQKHVFCGIYYEGKSTALLSTDLNQPEDTIRKALREAFSIIRSDRGN